MKNIKKTVRLGLTAGEHNGIIVVVIAHTDAFLSALGHLLDCR